MARLGNLQRADADRAGPTGPLLEVRDLRAEISRRSGTVHANRGLSYEIARGEKLGLVGESGSGKSIHAMTIMGLLPPTATVSRGSIHFNGVELRGLSKREYRRIRGRSIAMVFQDPLSSLNPVLTIGEQLTEVLQRHLRLSKRDARERAEDLLRSVSIPNAGQALDRYPHQLSGGMRQRVVIAMALACDPELIIADEPTTALDVTIQAQILELLSELARERGTAILIITHDLGVAANLTDRIAVMYAGRIVEIGPSESVLGNPKHPYTRGLKRAVPRLDSHRLDSHRSGMLIPIDGSPPNLADIPSGCAFHPRCPDAQSGCAVGDPVLEPTEGGRLVACWVHGRGGEPQ